MHGRRVGDLATGPAGPPGAGGDGFVSALAAPNVTINFGDFARHVVGSVDLPATGSYVINAKGTAFYSDFAFASADNVSCWLVSGGFFADSTTVTLTSSHQYLLPSGPLQVVGTTFANFALTTAIGGGGTITVQCNRGNGGSGQVVVEDVKITAVQVAAVHG